jgi:hypothetical protein
MLQAMVKYLIFDMRSINDEVSGTKTLHDQTLTVCQQKVKVQINQNLYDIPEKTPKE